MKFSSSARRGLAWIIILALALRSLVPTGYMPDGTAGHGLFALSVCDGHDHHMHHGGAQPHNDTCPFAAAATLALAGIDLPAIATPSFGPATLPPPVISYIVRQAVFGNASPRSPPHFS